MIKNLNYFISILAAIGFISCAKVEEGPVAVTSVSIDNKTLTLNPGKVKYLYATVLPDNATDRTVTWTSSEPSVASVDPDGTVHGISVGNTVITAAAGEFSDKCEVTVVAESILAESAVITPEELKLFANESQELSLRYTPETITESYVWKSSDTDVATVDRNGVVTAVSEGTAEISVIFEESGTTASSSVKVTEVMKIRRLDSGEIRTADYNLTRIKRVDTMRVARGEVADFQINVEALKTLGNVKAELMYFCKDTSRLEIALEPRIYWTGKVYCSRYWEDWSGGYPWNELNPSDRLFPDILIPADKKELMILENDNNSFWFDFYVPRDFSDGLYYGKVKISARIAGKDVCSYMDFNVRVYPVTLPEEQNLMVINWHGGSYAQMNDGSWDKGSEPDFQWNMRAKTIEFMNDYGQNGWTTMQRTATGASASVVGGKIVFDFSNWLWEVDFNDRHCRDIKLLQGYCFCGYNDYWNEQAPPENMIVRTVRYLDENGELRTDDLPATDQRTHDHLVNLFSQLSEVLHSYTLRNGRRLIDVYAQSIMDEPYGRHKVGYELVASAIKEGCPDIRIMEPTETAAIDENLLDWPCPNLDRLTTSYEEFKARDPQQQWLYVCLRPQGNCANRLFGQRVLNCRIMHWCNYRYNAIGYLHWGLCNWDKFEWTDRSFPTDAYNPQTPISPGGDHFILYPGEMTPYPSIRLCNMRDGVNDHELLKMVEKINPGIASSLCFRVVKETPESYNPSAHGVTARWKYYDENIDHFRETRREILEYLSEN